MTKKYNLSNSFKKRFTAMLEPEFYAKIKQRAKKEGVSNGLILNDIIRREFLTEKQYLIYKYKEALFEAQQYRSRLEKIKIENIKELEVVQ